MNPASAPPSDRPAIEVQGLSKRYRRGPAGLRVPWRAAPDLWALRDVTFCVQPGEALGVIGANGAGKSTLLKVLARITPPSSGRAVLRGRASALLEAGTGFHPELSGRDNVYLGGAVLGMSRAEVARRFDAIVEMSGVSAFLDTPVKRYSTGMRLRLAFAVAMHLEPEILLVDEILAVGDVAFQRQSLGHLTGPARGHRTLVLVSHDLNAVARLCDRVIVLEGGAVRDEGPSAEVLPRYLATSEGSGAGEESRPEDRTRPEQALRLAVRRQDGSPLTGPLPIDEPFVIEGSAGLWSPRPGRYLNVVLRDAVGQYVLFLDSRDHPQTPPVPAQGRYDFRVQIPAPLLAAGRYAVSLHVAYPREGILDVLEGAVAVEIVDHQSPRPTRPGHIHLTPPWERTG